MQTLVGWDNSEEADTINLLLNAGSKQAMVTTSPADFERAATSGSWDALIMSLGFPSEKEALELFTRIREADHDVPIIGAWEQGGITHLAKFISRGLNSYLMRDAEGDFIFLMPPLLEAAHEAALSQRARLLAERLREEVDSVRRLQESVIPQNLPTPHGYEIAARYEPAQIQIVGENPVTMAGGDYYDIFALDETQMILLVGDASGHGVKACMSIMTMHTLIRMFRQQRYASTVEFVREVNRRLCGSDIVSDQGGFITLLYCALDFQAHKIQWTAAGHPMPLLQDLASNEVVQLATVDEGGLPLAIDENWEYQQCVADLPRNSRLLIYTDGLDEAFPEDGDQEPFGLHGIVRSLKSSAKLPVGQALDKLFADSAEHTRGSGRLDDTSVVLLQRTAERQE